MIIEVRKGDLRAVLDVATQSMDFGSGFLDNEQVEALRKAADLLGISPADVTPTNFLCQYSGGHKWRYRLGHGGVDRWFCDECPAWSAVDPAPYTALWQTGRISLSADPRW